MQNNNNNNSENKSQHSVLVSKVDLLWSISNAFTENLHLECNESKESLMLAAHRFKLNKKLFSQCDKQICALKVE